MQNKLVYWTVRAILALLFVLLYSPGLGSRQSPAKENPLFIICEHVGTTNTGMRLWWETPEIDPTQLDEIKGEIFTHQEVVSVKVSKTEITFYISSGRNEDKQAVLNHIRDVLKPFLAPSRLIYFRPVRDSRR